MIELKGRYNKDCKILIDEVENEALALIQAILDQPASEGVPIRIQCDTHAGKGIVIGFTMPLTQLLNPAWVGCDVGCGMISAKFTSEKELNLEEIDNSIRKVVPMGFNLNSASIVKNIPFERAQETADKFVKKFNEKFGTSHIAPTYNEKWLMKMLKDIDMDVTKFYSAIGSLGSGNHFIELGKDSKDNYWITIHSGSRNFGLKVFDYWMNVANGKVKVVSDEYNKELDYILQNTYPKSDIPKKMKELKDKYKVGINKEYLSDENLIGYLFFLNLLLLIIS
jgi:RNA-splicing ligase RtcB